VVEEVVEVAGEAVAAAAVVEEVAAAKEASRPNRRLLLQGSSHLRVLAQLRAGLLPLHRLSGRKPGQLLQALQAQAVLQ